MAAQPLTLVVLAAGMGSRFGGAKQVEAVGPSGEIILDYSVFDALAAGFSRIVCVVRDEVEAVLRPRLTRQLAGRCDVTFVAQRVDDVPAACPVPAGRSRPWGTGQAVLACREVLSGPFVVVNADDFYGARAFATVARFLMAADGPPTTRNALVGYALAATLTEHGTVSRGVCEVNPCGRLLSIVERHGVERREREIGFRDRAGAWQAIPTDACASMNFWGLDPSLLPLLEREFRGFFASAPGEADEFRLPTAIGSLLDAHDAAVHVLRTESTWLGVTHREDLASVRSRIAAQVAAGSYPSPLWSERST